MGHLDPPVNQTPDTCLITRGGSQSPRREPTQTQENMQTPLWPEINPRSVSLHVFLSICLKVCLYKWMTRGVKCSQSLHVFHRWTDTCCTKTRPPVSRTKVREEHKQQLSFSQLLPRGHNAWQSWFYPHWTIRPPHTE